MISLIKQFFGICKHNFVFLRSINEQNLRGGYEHISEIYICEKCNKQETREMKTINQDNLHNRLADLHSYEEIAEHYAKCAVSPEALRDWVTEQMNTQLAPNDTGFIQPTLTDIDIETIAVNNGFKRKQQPNGLLALNPYVFDFARALLAYQAQPVTVQPDLKALVQKVHKAKGRHHTQIAMCELYDACGLPNERPDVVAKIKQ